MAKLTGPLFSLSASGKLAKTLVYADWKGIDYVRQYVTPSNPNSAGQQTQRGYLTTALANWHDTSNVLNATDIANLNFYAGLQSKPLSGFNAYVQCVVNELVSVGSSFQLFDTTEGTPSGGGMQVVITTVASTAGVVMVYGTSARSLNNVLGRTESTTPGTTHTFDFTGLTPGVTYYYKIRKSGGIEHMGIGSFVAA